MTGQGLAAHHRHGFVRREIMLVILEHGEAESCDQAVGRVAGHQVHLFFDQASVEQPEVHNPGRGGELQAVRPCQALEAVRALHEFVTKAGPPLGRITRGVRDCMQVEPPSLSPPYKDRKSTRLNSSHLVISYAVFCLKKKKRKKYSSCKSKRVQCP